jgi:hypothetical protein
LYQYLLSNRKKNKKNTKKTKKEREEEKKREKTKNKIEMEVSCTILHSYCPYPTTGYLGHSIHLV